MAARAPLTVAIFASDRGPGDAERASLMSQTGAHFAKRGARLITLADRDAMPLPAITSARAAGGQVTVFADEGFNLPPALSAISVEHIADRAARLERLTIEADCFVALPGSLGSMINLYETTLARGVGKPVVYLNRHSAFEILRGFVADIVTHGPVETDRFWQFADSVEDLWHKVAKVTGYRG